MADVELVLPEEGNSVGHVVSQAVPQCASLAGLGTLSVLVLTGCSTQLVSSPVDSTTIGPARGVIYYLPKTVLDVDITLQLKDCRVEQRGTQLVFHFDVARRADVTARTVADRSHAYVLNYEELAAATKTTAATIELTKASTLKAINVDVKDQTATVLANSVSSVLKIVSTVSRVPLPTSTESEQARMLEERYCGPAAKLAMQKIRELEKAASTANADDRTNLAAQVTEIRRRELTHRLFALFDPKPGSGGNVASVEPKSSIIDGWISPRGLAHLKEQRPDLFAGSSPSPLSTEIAVAWNGNAKSAVTGKPDGFVYRPAVEAEVAICAGKCGDGSGTFDVPRSDRLYSSTYAFSQLGDLAVLPFSNGAFQDNLLKVDWSDTGGVTRVEFSSSAQAEKASAAVLDATGRVSEVVSNRRAAQAAAITKARSDELAEITHRKARLDALIQLKESQDAYNAKFPQ